VSLNNLLAIVAAAAVGVGLAADAACTGTGLAGPAVTGVLEAAAAVALPRPAVTAAPPPS